jgi:8-oxo-dGTP pyrophosphatase MutT (NUDIX family)
MISGNDIYGNPAELDPDKVRWRPSVYGLIVRENQVVVLENIYSGTYELPGGGVAVSETLTAGLKREIMEECNLTVSVQNLITTDEQFFLSPGGNHWHTLRFFYRVTRLSGTLRLNDPDENAVNPHWHPLHDLTPDNIAVHWHAVQILQQQQQ